MSVIRHGESSPGHPQPRARPRLPRCRGGQGSNRSGRQQGEPPGRPLRATRWARPVVVGALQQARYRRVPSSPTEPLLPQPRHLHVRAGLTRPRPRTRTSTSAPQTGHPSALNSSSRPEPRVSSSATALRSIGAVSAHLGYSATRPSPRQRPPGGAAPTFVLSARRRLPLPRCARTREDSYRGRP